MINNTSYTQHRHKRCQQWLPHPECSSLNCRYGALQQLQAGQIHCRQLTTGCISTQIALGASRRGQSCLWATRSAADLSILV